MTYRHAAIGLAVAAIIADVPASARTYADGVRRGATAEAADFADGIGWINRVVDSDGCVGFGDSVLSARVGGPS